MKYIIKLLNLSLTDIVPSYKPPALPMQSQPAPQCSSTGTDSIMLFLPSTMSPITGQPYLCATHMTQSPRGLLLTQQTPSATRADASRLGISRRRPSHTPSSSNFPLIILAYALLPHNQCSRHHILQHHDIALHLASDVPL